MLSRLIICLTLLGNLPHLVFAQAVSDAERAELAFTRAENEAAMGDWQNALRFYEEALKWADKPDYRYRAAYAATQCRPPRWNVAKQKLRRNTDTQSLLLLAEIEWGQHNFKAAHTYLAKAEQQSPDDPKIRRIEPAEITLAWAKWADTRWGVEHHKSDAETAIEYYRRFLRQQPNTPQGGEVHQHLRRLEHGEAGRLMNMAIRVLRAGEYERAWRFLKRAAEIEPGWIEIAYWRGQLCSIKAAYRYCDETGKTSEEYWRDAQQMPAARLALAKLYFQRGEWEAALREAVTAAENAPNWVPPLFLLGEIYHRQGIGEAARTYFERVVTLAPETIFAVKAERLLKPESIEPPRLMNWRPVRQKLLEDFGPIVTDATLQHRLEMIVSKLYTANAMLGRMPNVRLLANEAPHAFCLPPDELFVTVGLVNFVDTQLQLQPIADHVLAFALGHEWTHLLQRDFERSQEIQGLISILATGREVEWVHFQSSLARSTEVYSDRYGLLLAYRARYKPTAAIAWCEAMEASVGDRQMNRDHPTLSERRMLLERYLEGDLQRAYDQFDVGLATFRRRDMGAATTAFEAYLDFLPNDGAALENLSILYFLRGVELLNGTPWAPFRLTHDLQTEPDLPPPQTRGDIPPEAVAWWERARFGANLLQRLHPDRPGAYQVLGDVALAFGELEQAQTIYAAGLELAPTHTGLLNNLGVCYALKKETLSARRLFEGVKGREVGEWNLKALGN